MKIYLRDGSKASDKYYDVYIWSIVKAVFCANILMWCVLLCIALVVGIINLLLSSW
jgi:hypothetical protein